MAQQLVAAVPLTWVLAEAKEDQVPWGHHWSDGYRGHGGTKLILVGPTPVNFHWKDHGGQWHDDPLARESLELWIMPAEYREGCSGFHAPIPAELVIANDTTRVYALPAHHLNSEVEFNDVLKNATSTEWPSSLPLSWKTWEADVSKAVVGGA